MADKKSSGANMGALAAGAAIGALAGAAAVILSDSDKRATVNKKIKEYQKTGEKTLQDLKKQALELKDTVSQQASDKMEEVVTAKKKAVKKVTKKANGRGLPIQS